MLDIKLGEEDHFRLNRNHTRIENRTIVQCRSKTNCTIVLCRSRWIETIRHFPGDLATFKVSGQTDRGIERDVAVGLTVARSAVWASANTNITRSVTAAPAPRLFGCLLARAGQARDSDYCAATSHLLPAAAAGAY